MELLWHEIADLDVCCHLLATMALLAATIFVDTSARATVLLPADFTGCGMDWEWFSNSWNKTFPGRRSSPPVRTDVPT